MSPRLPSIFDFSLGDSLSGAAREGGARPAGWHLDAIGVPFLRARGLTGRGVRIGVVDTGVKANHPDLDRDRITVFHRQEGGFLAIDLTLFPF
jgi:subtilisin family serine protease